MPLTTCIRLRLPPFASLCGLRRRIAYRRVLRRLLAASPHLIADIGLSQAEAEVEIAKRFWQA